MSAEANHHLTLLVLGLDIHDAGGGVIDEAEGEASVGIRSRLVLFVERDRCLARLAQPADHAQLPTRDHRLIDQDVGHSGRQARDEDGSDQQAFEHRAFPAQKIEASPERGQWVNSSGRDISDARRTGE
ncbi:hypothetical protein ACETIH_06400 [Microvirga arabica]|uniref:Uncharacterized protein n=1 Tax=Microvirga arabica TaxID=1128671 RepID=A0ABV6Y502_9HYPH